MDTKVCTKCGIKQNVVEFSKRSSAKDGLKSQCKSCDREYVLANKERISKKRKEYYYKNIDRMRERQKRYVDANRDRLNEKQRVYYKNNKESCKSYQLQYRIDNPELIRENRKEYYKNNKDIIKKQKQNYKKRRATLRREQYNNSPEFRMELIMRSRLYRAIQDYSLVKEHKTMEYLGCTIGELMNYLQQTAIANGYVNFDIYNYNGEEYHVDHIIPFANVGKGLHTLDEVSHYTNLQILRAEDNLSKGANHNEKDLYE